MEAAWIADLTKHVQMVNALAQKRSAACTMMQDAFSGEDKEPAAASS
jgi:hypothetical protein